MTRSQFFKLIIVLSLATAAAGALSACKRSNGQTNAAASASPTPPVVEVSAKEGRGIDAVWTLIQKHGAQLSESGELAQKRKAQLQHWFKGLLDAAVRAHFLERPEIVQALADAERDIDALRVTPTAAADRVIALLGK